MDVFDEFEMKPLTDGLGFHRKKEQISDAFDEVEAVEKAELLSTAQTQVQNKSVDRATQALDKLMDSLNTLDKKGITFTDTLPAKETHLTAKKLDKQIDQIEAFKKPSIHPVVPNTNPEPKVDIPQPINEVLNKVTSNTDEMAASLGVGARRGSSDSLIGSLKELSVSIPSSILDLIVVLAMSILFLVSMLFTIEASLDTVIYSFSSDLMSQISAGMLFVVVLQIYVVVSRSLFGCTLGEWTFDCQMGKDEQVKTGYYPIQNLWRSLLMIGTGLIVLPLLSLISRRDLAKYLTGLQLYKKV